MSSDELTDKEIDGLVNKFAINCPNCEGRLALQAGSAVSDTFRDEIRRHILNGNFSLASVEYSAEDLRAVRDRGGLDSTKIRTRLKSYA